MTLTQFNATMQPRVTGTKNLHMALTHHPLDFFITLSSWTTIFGSASQSNYMASNAFMDAFAAHRRTLNLPSASLGLGHILDVGIVSQIPQYQENLNKMGLYGNSEQEFLQYCDTAITPPLLAGNAKTGKRYVNTPAHQAHMLVGVAPSGLLTNDPRYSLSSMSWHADPRFSRLLAATARLSASHSATNQDGILVNEDDPNESILNRIHKRVARFLYMPAEDIDVKAPIAQYGLDSLVAAEVRNWLFGSFGARVGSLVLLQPTMTVERLVGEVEGEMGKEKGKG